MKICIVNIGTSTEKSRIVKTILLWHKVITTVVVITLFHSQLYINFIEALRGLGVQELGIN